jgi:hypothetical protein
MFSALADFDIEDDREKSSRIIPQKNLKNSIFGNQF